VLRIKSCPRIGNKLIVYALKPSLGIVYVSLEEVLVAYPTATFKAMTSVVAPVAFGSPSIKRPGDPIIPAMQGSQTHRKKKVEAEDKPRGRRRSRVHKPKDASGEGSGPDETRNGDEGQSSGADGPSRKRRRSRKGLDKKFECPQEGCGKSYSRAEHLYVSISIPLLLSLVLTKCNLAATDTN
jgi:hypothetical protein